MKITINELAIDQLYTRSRMFFYFNPFFFGVNPFNFKLPNPANYGSYPVIFERNPVYFGVLHHPIFSLLLCSSWTKRMPSSWWSPS